MFLNNDVFWIKGESGNSCLYDLRDKYASVFHLNKAGGEYIEKILNNENVDLRFAESLIENGILVEQRTADKKGNLAQKVKIDFAWIEITKSCPYRCIHCYNESDVISENCHMELSDVYAVVDKLKRYGIKRVQLIGGEPTCHPYYKDIIIACAENFEDVEVFTNGYFISDELIDIYIRYGVHFAFSYYSDIEDEYEKVTGIRGSYNRISRTINLLKSKGISYRLQCVKLKGVNYSEEFLQSINGKPDMPRLTGSASIDLYDNIMIKEKYITRNKMSYLSSKVESKQILQRMYYHNCFSKKIYIDYNLNCYPCVMERELLHGNIRDKEIADVLVCDICQMNKDCIDGCKNCEYRYVCFDCRPDRGSSGVNDQPWYCLYNPHNGEWKEIREVF